MKDDLDDSINDDNIAIHQSSDLLFTYSKSIVYVFVRQ